MMLRTKILCRLGVVILLWIGSVSIAHAQPSGFMEKDVTVYGFNMHYVEAGSGPPLVLLHGLWGGQNEWRLNMEPLSTNFRVIVLDQIGFGESDKPHANYHNALLAQFLVGFLEALEIPNATLVGHAMGANTTTYMAVHYPHLVEQIVLVDGAGYRNPNRDLARPLTEPQIKFRRIVTGSDMAATKNFLKRRVYDPELITDSWVQEAFTLWLKSARAIENMLLEGGDVTEEEMRTIRVPTLIVWGKEDRVFPLSNADRLNQDIAGSQKVIFDKTGHLPQVEVPEKFNRLIYEFLTTGKVKSESY